MCDNIQLFDWNIRYIYIYIVNYGASNQEAQETIYLFIYFGFLCSFFRIGAIIIALHDASDVFMETAKICKYSEKEFGASVGFSLFALSWLLLRLIYFPFWIIRATRYSHSLFLPPIYNFIYFCQCFIWHSHLFCLVKALNSWIMWIWHQLKAPSCTIPSTHCYWRFLFSTYIGGISSAQWLQDYLKTEDKWEKT